MSQRSSQLAEILKFFSSLALVLAFTAPALGDALINGAATINGCSGGVVRLKGRADTSHALVITNGHCIPVAGPDGRDAYLQPNESIYNRDVRQGFGAIDVRVYNGKQTGEPVKPRKVVFATMTSTDFALIELEESYEQLKSKYDMRAFELSDQPAPLHQPLIVYASLFGRSQNCSVQTHVDLTEGPYQTKQALKFEQSCSIYKGFSGSPVLLADARTLVGVANTHFDASSERSVCDLNKPCERNSSESPIDGQSYGVETYSIYKCLSEDGSSFDFLKSGCSLGPISGLPQKAKSRAIWNYGGTEVLPVDQLDRTLVAIGNRKSAVCSGTFVAKNVVLTAAHCVIPDDNGDAIGKVGDYVYPLSLNEGYDPIRGEKIRISEVVIHPKKKELDIWIPVGDNQFPFDNPDLALLKLETPYERAEPAAIASLSRLRNADKAEFVGFGKGNSNWQRPSRIKFAIAHDQRKEIRLQYTGVESGNTMDFIEAMIKNLDRLTPSIYVVRSEKPGEQTLCYGDSGGPLFVRDQGRVEILGVASLYVPHPTRGNSSCGDSFLNVFGKIEPHRDWLVREIARLSK